jgi:hypothetical protein
MQLVFASTWLLAMLQGWLVLWRPALYVRVRPHLVVTQRLHRILVICSLALRQSWRDGVVALASADQASQDWRQFFYVNSTVSILSFLGAVNFWLPVTLQLPMALLKMGVDVFVFAPTITRALHGGSTLGGFSTSACEASLLAVTRLCAAIHPVGLGGARGVACRDPASSGVTFVVFMMLFTGNMLPTCICYMLERALKLRYLGQLGFQVRQATSVWHIMGLLYTCAVACAAAANLLAKLPLFGAAGG